MQPSRLNGRNNMEQFSLEKYLKNPSRKVITRDGKSARIICTNRLDENYPVLALVRNEDYEMCYSYTTFGKLYTNQNICRELDLLFAPEKKIGWTNVYKYTFGGTHLGEVIYNSKEEAENNAKVYETDINTYITTIKIEWEE